MRKLPDEERRARKNTRDRKWYRENKEYRKEYRAANKERKKETTRLWRENNKEHVKAYRKLYRSENSKYINEYNRLMRTNNREYIAGYKRKYRAENPEKAEAGYLVYHAVRSGRISRPDRCSNCCEVGHIEGHHPDYTKPLDVVWLCKTCHAARHPRDIAHAGLRGNPVL